MISTIIVTSPIHHTRHTSPKRHACEIHADMFSNKHVHKPHTRTCTCKCMQSHLVLHSALRIQLSLAPVVIALTARVSAIWFVTVETPLWAYCQPVCLHTFAHTQPHPMCTLTHINLGACVYSRTRTHTHQYCTQVQFWSICTYLSVSNFQYFYFYSTTSQI